MLPQSLERILLIGGSISIDSSQYLPVSMERFAALAAKSGASLTIRNAQKLLPISLERIAAIGQGRVIFQLD